MTEDERHDDCANASYPHFLHHLKSDRNKGIRGFYNCAWRLLQAYPPSCLCSLSQEDREDVISKVVMHCLQRDCAVLLNYKDQGRPFKHWLRTVARNKCLDHLRRKMRHKEDTLVDQLMGTNGESRNTDYELRDFLEIVLQHIGRMSRKCQLLLLCASDQHKAKVLQWFLGFGNSHDGNVKASNDLRYCRRLLRESLDAEGISPDDYLRG